MDQVEFERLLEKYVEARIAENDAFEWGTDEDVSIKGQKADDAQLALVQYVFGKE